MTEPLDHRAPAVQQCLREVFGIDALRPAQIEPLDAVLAGRDVLVTEPTGAGKSLIFQLPAVVAPGLTLVISPLIALMKDQVDGLQARGVRATFVNSSLMGRQRQERLQRAVAGEFDLLYVTPERFQSAQFDEQLPRLNIARLAVDEAHCISHWGHDFRPDYSRLGQYRSRLGNPPAVALTATATPAVAADIVTQLQLREPLICRGGVERGNLFLATTEVADAAEKVDRVEGLIRETDGPGIVYFALIRELEWMHGELRRRGVETLVYHGDLSREERRAMQQRFMQRPREVVLATNAFGMGVDKYDIRFVAHAQLPRTLEAWTQEVGRAGRDDRPAWCELFYWPEDVAVQQTFVDWANPTLEFLQSVYDTLSRWGERLRLKSLDDLRNELLHKQRADHRVSICLKWLEVLGVTEGSFERGDLRVVRGFDLGELPPLVGTDQKRQHDLQGLLKMVQFATQRETCRRVLLAEHFGLPWPAENCGSCDVCVAAEDWRAGRMRPRVVATVREDPPEDAERAQDRGSASTTFGRGDWVRIDGRFLGRVVRVERNGRRLVVESADDLRQRMVDPRRQRVERIE